MGNGRKKRRNERITTSIAASSYVKEESYKVNAMMMYSIATYTHASPHRFARTLYIVHEFCKYVKIKERESESSKEEYFNNACHTIVCSFVCLFCPLAHTLTCSLANSLIHLFFFFCLWGFYSSFYSFLCSFLCD